MVILFYQLHVRLKRILTNALLLKSKLPDLKFALGYSPSMSIFLQPAAIRNYLAKVLVIAGGSEQEADLIATNLVDANLHGHDSHGLVRLKRYLAAIKAGHVHFGRQATSVITGPSYALLDGNHAFGQVLIPQVITTARSLVQNNGVGMVGLRHAGHLGRIGAFADLSCAAGLACIIFVNVRNSTLVTPFGGIQRHMSTAPICIGIPSDDGAHFCLDFATSQVAEGKTLLALLQGTKVPAGALIDTKGQPTDDPKVLYGNPKPNQVPDPRAGPGAMEAFGFHKGSGLALACELLAGALTGSAPTNIGDTQLWNGLLGFFFNPIKLDDGFGHQDLMAQFLNEVRNTPPRAGVDQVLVPGDRSRQTMARRYTEGLPVSPELITDLLQAGAQLGLNENKSRQILELADT